ncbi:hypothetical protein LguiB_021402 [Lonicera macranthoides]
MYVCMLLHLVLLGIILKFRFEKMSSRILSVHKSNVKTSSFLLKSSQKLIIELCFNVLDDIFNCNL